MASASSSGANPPRLALRLRSALTAGEGYAKSSDSVHVVALRSDHVVQHRGRGHPDVVIRTLREVVRAHNSDTGLAPCLPATRFDQRLLDGRVLAAGGGDGPGNAFDSAELFTP